MRVMPSSPDIIARLWTAARAMFARMRDAVGEAATIGAREAMSEKERRVSRAWLGPIVAMVRKIVLIEAIALLASAAPLGPPASRSRVRERSGAASAKPGPKPARTTSLRLWPRQPVSAGPR